MYKFYLFQYRLKKITAEEVWTAADEGKLTTEEATKICGPRPKG